MWSCFYNYGAQLSGLLGRRSSAIISYSQSLITTSLVVTSDSFLGLEGTEVAIYFNSFALRNDQRFRLRIVIIAYILSKCARQRWK